MKRNKRGIEGTGKDGVSKETPNSGKASREEDWNNLETNPEVTSKT